MGFCLLLKHLVFFFLFSLLFVSYFFTYSNNKLLVNLLMLLRQCKRRIIMLLMKSFLQRNNQSVLTLIKHFLQSLINSDIIITAFLLILKRGRPLMSVLSKMTFYKLPYYKEHFGEDTTLMCANKNQNKDFTNY